MSQYTKVFIPWRGPSLNKIYAGVHWSKRKKLADAGHLACLIAKQACQQFRVPVTLKFIPVLMKGERRHDCSNYALSATVIEDGLVAHGILPNDTPEWVTEITIAAPVRGDVPGMFVEIRTIDKPISTAA